MAGGAALLMAAIFLTHTAMSWRQFDEHEMSGVEAALADISEDDRVLGLDYLPTSSRFGGRPFVHISAYASVRHGAATNFSFASNGSSIVRFRGARIPPFTRGLYFNAFQVQRSDYAYFDKVLVNLTASDHERFALQSWVRPLTHHGRWRLYEVLP